MKFWKKMLIVSITSILVFGVGYFIHHATRFNKNIPLSSLKENLYMSDDESIFINFNNLKPIIFFYNDINLYISDYKYQDGLLTFDRNDVHFSIYVLDTNSLYFENSSCYLNLFKGD